MTPWLVRTSQNLIAGPYAQEQICQMIQEGQLTLQDEICSANGYWFQLHERQEVMRYLGIEVPKSAVGSDDEATQTDTTLTQEMTQTLESELPIPDLPEIADDSPADASRRTFVINNEALKKFIPQKQALATHTKLPKPKFYKPLVLGQIERPSFWKGIAGVLIGVIFILLVLVLKIIH